MFLEYAILGFLQYEPMSEYDLKKIFDTSVRHFWPADQSQIYRTLNRLADRALVDMEVVQQMDRPRRKPYRITSPGKEALSTWLSSSTPKDEHRSAQLLQVFFAGRLADAQIVATLEQQAEHIRDELEHLAEIPGEARQFVDAVGSAREAYFWMLTLDAGITGARAQLAWLEHVIDEIRKGAAPSSAVPSSSGPAEAGESEEK